MQADVKGADLVMQQLEEVGISFNCVTWQLEHEGVQSFVDAYDDALKLLDGKRQKISQATTV